MPLYLTAYAATVIVFFAIDLVWLGVVARGFYVNQLGHLMLDKPNMAAAAGFYLVYVIGLIIFAVAPALRDGNIMTALIFGGLFGFFAYATYDMTNYATLKDWPVAVVVADIVWGAVVSGVSAAAGFWLTRLVMPG